MLSGPNSPNTLGTPSRSSAPAMGLAIATWALEVNRSQGLRDAPGDSRWRVCVGGESPLFFSFFPERLQTSWCNRCICASFQLMASKIQATSAFAHRSS